MNYRIIQFGVVMIIIFGFSCDDKSRSIDDIIVNGDSNSPFKGKVHCAEVGLEGVVVTDGYNFDVTDNYGDYSLPYSRLATHIYISTPAGYTVSVVNSVPQFYKKLSSLTDSEKVNFELIKLEASDKKHYFIGIADPQVRNDSEILKLKPILNQLRSYLDENDLGPVHLMVAGDIVFDQYHMHESIKTTFSQVNKPVYYAIGNHDHLINKAQPASDAYDKIADNDYVDHYGPTYYSFNRGDVHYVVLDNILYKGGPDTEYSTYFTNEQLDWLQKDLSYISKNKALVVMFHSPTRTPFTNLVGNSQELWYLLEGYTNVQLISGHTHYHATMVHNSGYVEHIIGAICGGWWEGPVCRCGTPLGYKLFEADGNNITWKYVAYEYPDEQFTIHKPEIRDPRLRPAEELLVNVWDWDPDWQVKYSEDGGSTYKDLIRITQKTVDPIAFQYFGFQGDNAVPMRSWIYASTTDHIFRCVPDESTTNVIVKVISRFGEEYIRNVDLK